eukprot:jgi/Mesvir1/20498/Mv12384-RA.1
MAALDPLTDASEVTPGRLYFIPIKRIASLRHSPLARAGHCFCVDEELVYQPFFADFGPLNLGQTYRYCELLRHILKDTAAEGKKVFHITSGDPHKLANSAVLMGLYQVICEKMSADDAYKPLAKYGPYVPFRDPSCGVSTHHLTVLDCLKGMERAVKENFIDFNNFDIDYYEHYEQVENGDLNWMLKNKLLAFSGPSAKRTEFHGYRSLVPEDYIQVFKKGGVTAVVRLNKKMYDKRRFTDHGIRHYDLFFPDGSCPSESILLRFMEIAEAEPGAVAIHCKAGLGRTGVLIGGYLMKHFNFTAEEVIGYLRILRPGSIIGPQQHYMKEVQDLLYREGAEFRRRGGKHSFDLEAAGALGGDSPLDDGGGEEERVANASPMKPLRSGTRPTIIDTGEGRRLVEERKAGRTAGINVAPPSTPPGSTRSKSTTRASSYSSSSGAPLGTPSTPLTPLTPSMPSSPFQSRLRSGTTKGARDNRLTRSATSTVGSPLSVATARYKLANQTQVGASVPVALGSYPCPLPFPLVLPFFPGLLPLHMVLFCCPFLLSLPLARLLLPFAGPCPFLLPLPTGDRWQASGFVCPYRPGWNDRFGDSWHRQPHEQESGSHPSPRPPRAHPHNPTRWFATRQLRHTSAYPGILKPLASAYPGFSCP